MFGLLFIMLVSKGDAVSISLMGVVVTVVTVCWTVAGCGGGIIFLAAEDFCCRFCFLQLLASVFVGVVFGVVFV